MRQDCLGAETVKRVDDVINRGKKLAGDIEGISPEASASIVRMLATAAKYRDELYECISEK